MNLLEKLISQDFTITGHGRWLRTLEHDSLVIDTHKQRFFWNSRGLSGDAYTWLTKIKNISPEEAKYAIKNKETVLFSKKFFKPEKNAVIVHKDLVDIFYNNGKNYREYWYNIRGYTDETIDRFKLGFSGEWYTIPIFVDGHFANFQCRKIHPKIIRPWYYGLGALPFNFSGLQFANWTVLTEGPVDAIMLVQHGIPAISQTGGAGTWKSLWSTSLAHLNRIYIVYDNDEAGYVGAKKVAQKLGIRAKVYNLWHYNSGADITAFFKAGNTVETFMNKLKNDSVYSFQMPKGGFIDFTRKFL